MTIVLGTRGSALALAQAEIVRAALVSRHPGLGIETKIIRTIGDERLDVRLSDPGPLDKGLFTKELESALLDGTIDAAVHSLKDLPTGQPDGLCLGAILQRADTADILVSKTPGGLASLPRNALVGTSSLRRERFLRWLRPDLRFLAIRGNVPTRVRKLGESGELDAIVLAAAGLDRLGDEVPRAGLDFHRLAEVLPAPGQGAIALQCRSGKNDFAPLLSPIDHPGTAAAVSAERHLLALLGGGCHLPLGARAEIVAGQLELRAILFIGEAAEPRQATVSGPIDDPAAIARAAHSQLL